MTRVVVAIPTIAARPGMAEHTAERWAALTPDADVTAIITTAGTTWGDGLNDAYEMVRHELPAVFVAASDDMIPSDASWLPAVLPWLERGCYPCPRVSDPRFENYGGHPQPVEDGTPSDMSTFPILRGDWLDIVFPLPEGLHYWSDNMLSVLLDRTGVPIVAVPSCRIMHMHAQEGRGAGYGSENARMYVDTVRFSRHLASLGIDRNSLPPGQRGGMWEPHFLAAGEALGA